MLGKTTMQRHTFKFKGDGAEFLGIWIVNILLSILTLGIYSAWAKVRTHRYFYGNTEIDGDRFDYLAQPKQILIGRIVAVIALVTWSILTQVSPAVAGLLAVILYLLMPILMVRNLRFDMKMTQFRNVRFNFTGSYKGAYVAFLLKPLTAYIVIIAGFAFTKQILEPVSVPAAVITAMGLVFLVLPFLSAWVIVGVKQYILNHIRYGNLKFKTLLSPQNIFTIILKCMLIVFALVASLALIIGFTGATINRANLTDGAMDASFASFIIFFYFGFILVSFLIHAYFQSQLRNYIFSATKLDDEIQLVSNMTTWGYAKLIFTNLLIIIFTLGIGRPLAMVRHASYFASVTQLEGDLALTAAKDQASADTSAIADEVSQAFDLDLGAI